jgi:hypothetical protein
MRVRYLDFSCDFPLTRRPSTTAYRGTLDAACKELLHRRSMRLLGTYLWTTLDFPDRLFGWDQQDREIAHAIQAHFAEQRGAKQHAVPPRVEHTVG